MTTINQIFHSSMCLMYSFTLYRTSTIDLSALSGRRADFDPGQMKYLTIWNVIIQAVYFFICLLNDWFGTNAVNPKKPPFIRKLKDYAYAVYSFPLALFVGTTFWSIMLVDRELVFPRVLDAYFPWWLNHLMHTMIMVSILIETFLTPRNYPSRKNGYWGQMSFILTYLAWVHIIYYKSGIWVYPVMEVLTWPLRLLFFATLVVFCAGLYMFGEVVDNFVWGNEHSKQKKSYAKSK